MTITDMILSIAYLVLIVLKLVGHVTYPWWAIIILPFLCAYAINLTVKYFWDRYVKKLMRKDITEL